MLRLRDFIEVFSVDEDVKPGTYSKIRLILSDLILVKLNDDGSIAEEHAAKLGGNGKIDLNPRSTFEISPGAVVFLTLDFDVDKSLKITETGNGKFKVRPVIFVNIGTEPAFRGLTRVTGIIQLLSIEYDGFLLCQSKLVAASDDDDDDDDSDDKDRHCVRVAIDEDTGVFGEDGLPVDYMSLVAGDAVTVVGRLGRRMDNPEIEALSENDDDSERHEPFLLRAFVIENGLPGAWSRVKGIVATDVDLSTDTFALAVSPAQGFAPETEIVTQLYPSSRIFSARGIELDRSALTVDKPVIADGVLALSSTEADVLRSALVITGHTSESGGELIKGELLNRDGTTLNVATDTGDRCVLAADATVLLVTADNDGIHTDELSLESLETGQALRIFGSEDIGGCFVADAIIVTDSDD